MISLEEIEQIKKHLGVKSLSFFFNDLPKSYPSMPMSSLSHTKDFKALATSSERVGFDMEDLSRVSPSIESRISQKEDGVYPLGFLWSAKEAAFKSTYGKNQVSSFNQIIIKNWTPKTESIWLFSFEHENKTQKGVVLQKENMIFAFCSCF